MPVREFDTDPQSDRPDRGDIGVTVALAAAFFALTAYALTSLVGTTHWASIIVHVAAIFIFGVLGLIALDYAYCLYSDDYDCHECSDEFDRWTVDHYRAPDAIETADVDDTGVQP